MKRMIFWGGTGQAKVLRECMQGSKWQLVAVFDNSRQIKAPFDDVPLFFGESAFESWLSREVSVGEIGFLVAIGGQRGKDRVGIQNYLLAKGLMSLIAKHRTAFVAENCTIGAGTQILAHAAVCVEARLGHACIINTGATVDHECYIGNGVHICPGAHLAGGVQVGDYAMIGTNATVIPRVRIGEGALVGAGSVVLKDVPDYCVVVGNPARILRREMSKEKQQL